MLFLSRFDLGRKIIESCRGRRGIQKYELRKSKVNSFYYSKFSFKKLRKTDKSNQTTQFNRLYAKNINFALLIQILGQEENLNLS